MRLVEWLSRCRRLASVSGRSGEGADEGLITPPNHPSRHELMLPRGSNDYQSGTHRLRGALAADGAPAGRNAGLLPTAARYQG